MKAKSLREEYVANINRWGHMTRAADPAIHWDKGERRRRSERIKTAREWLMDMKMKNG